MMFSTGYTLLPNGDFSEVLVFTKILWENSIRDEREQMNISFVGSFYAFEKKLLNLKAVFAKKLISGSRELMAVSL